MPRPTLQLLSCCAHNRPVGCGFYMRFPNTCVRQVDILAPAAVHTALRPLILLRTYKACGVQLPYPCVRLVCIPPPASARIIIYKHDKNISMGAATSLCLHEMHSATVGTFQHVVQGCVPAKEPRSKRKSVSSPKIDQNVISSP